MAGILELAALRNKYPVVFDDTVTVFVRSLTHGELAAARTIDDDLSVAFAIGKCLLETNGTPVLPPKTETESNAEWAKRVEELLKPLGIDTTNQIWEAIKKCAKEPLREKLEKKS